MVIQHNIPALNAHRLLGVNNANTAKNLEKLSSGYKINRAGDDAAGLAISEKMRGQIRGLGMAEQNAENAISLIQTAEGGMQELHAISQRMREIAVQATNGTYQDDVDRDNLDLEFQQLKEEFDRITDYTNYNGIKLLNGVPYTTTTVAATNSLSDLAGATSIDDSATVQGAATLTLDANAANAGQVKLEISYNAAGDLVVNNVGADTNLSVKSFEVKDGDLIVTLTDGQGTEGTIDLVIDGDWDTGIQVDKFEKSFVSFKLSTAGKIDATQGIAVRTVTTGGATYTAADVNGVTNSAATKGAGAGNPSNYTDLAIRLYFDADGAFDKEATETALKAVLDAKNITYTGVAVTSDGTDIKIEINESATASTILTWSGADGTAAAGVEYVEYTVNTNAGVGTVVYADTSARPVADDTTHQADILFQVGANGTFDQQVTLTIYDMHATQLGKGTDLSLVTGLDDGYTAFTGWAAEGQTGTTYQIADQGTNGTPQISVQDLHVQDKNAANIAIEVMTTAINEISFRRAELGAVQNRLEYTLNNLGVTKENLTSAESTIRDVDMAKEMTEFTKNNILVQASQAMLAQANALPQGVLNLLR